MKESLDKHLGFVWSKKWEFLCGILLLLGIIAAFFYPNIGAALAGLGLGLGFYYELRQFVGQLKSYCEQRGVFKTALLIGGAIFFLVALTPFLIAVAVGFGIIRLVEWTTKTKG